MNRFNIHVINEFRSNNNVSILHSKLREYFDDPVVDKYLNYNLATLMDEFCNTIASELTLSDPIPGVTVYELVTGFNNQFLQDRVSFIATYIVGISPEVSIEPLIIIQLVTECHLRGVV